MKNKPKPSLHQHANGFLFRKAKELRRKTTPAEDALWHRLRAKAFLNLKFRQQHPIGKYIADFYCHALQLVIEVDGGYHSTETQQKKDNFRDEEMKRNSLNILRFSNEDVLENMEDVLDKIRGKAWEIEADVASDLSGDKSSPEGGHSPP